MQCNFLSSSLLLFFQVSNRRQLFVFSCSLVTHKKLWQQTCLLTLEKAFHSYPEHFTVNFWVCNFIQFLPLLHTVEDDFSKGLTIKPSISIKHSITKLLLYQMPSPSARLYNCNVSHIFHICFKNRTRTKRQ